MFLKVKIKNITTMNIQSTYLLRKLIDVIIRFLKKEILCGRVFLHSRIITQDYSRLTKNFKIS